MKPDKASIVRLVALLVSLAAYFGLHVPEDVTEYIVGAIMLGIVLWGHWKNNYLGKKGQRQKEILKKHSLK